MANNTTGIINIGSFHKDHEISGKAEKINRGREKKMKKVTSRSPGNLTENK